MIHFAKKIVLQNIVALHDLTDI